MCVYIRIVVAPAGSTYISDEGTELSVKKASVGGVVSEGMFCDSKMLGWSGGGKGVAVQVPDRYEVGSAPPSSKPQQVEEPVAPEPKVEVKGLYEKKLTKEEKKKLAEERRKARKAAKAAKEAAADNNVAAEQ